MMYFERNFVINFKNYSLICFWIFLQECTLCFLRGGALKATTDGQWCHIVCALSLPDVSFQSINSRGPVDIMKISQKRAKLVNNIVLCLYDLSVLFFVNLSLFFICDLFIQRFFSCATIVINKAL